MKHNGLEVYDITLTKDNVGIKATALTILPAIESQFLHFNEDKPQFLFSSEDKRELVGAIMIPDKFIYRDIGGHKFYVNFTKDVIKDLTGKMIQTGAAGLFNIEHKFACDKDDVEVLEVWVKDSEEDKSVALGINEPIGTAFMKVRVNNETLWNEAKDNGLNGFSVELDASIVEKEELIFNKTENKMSLKDVFSNSIEVGGKALYFNSNLGKNAYLVNEVEGKAVGFEGEFTYEKVKYTVANGIVTDAVDIELSTKENIESLRSDFGALTEKIDVLLQTKEDIEVKKAELEQLEAQFKLDKEDFEKSKKPKGKVSTNFSSKVVDSANGSKSWLAKFK